MVGGLDHGESARERTVSRMAQKRQYGSGQIKEARNGWVIRWWEPEIARDGSKQKALRYERLGAMCRKQAAEILAQRIATAGNGKAIRSRVVFRRLVAEWETSILPMYKPSTQKHRRFMLKKHLLPEFGDRAVCEIGRQDIQGYVARLMRDEYAPKSIDHIHDVLSAVLRTAVQWGHLPENPARGVELPTLKCVRPKWALTPAQALALIDALPGMARAMVGLTILSGLRRGELFALRWRDIDEAGQRLTVREAVYDGQFGTPKTGGGHSPNPALDGGAQAGIGVEGPGEAHGRGRAGLRHSNGWTDCAKQRPTSGDLPGVRPPWTAACDVADVPPDLFVLVPPARRAGQGDGAADGSRERGHDDQRVHAGAGRLGARRRRAGRKRIERD